MKYSTQPKISQKKVQNEHIYYLIKQTNRKPKWVSFQHMNKQQLELVILYEKEQEDNRSRQRVLQKIQQQQQPEETEDAKPKPRGVDRLVFMNKVDGELFFKVYYSEGLVEIVNNNSLKKRHPIELIQFYEKHVSIEEQIP